MSRLKQLLAAVQAGDTEQVRHLISQKSNWFMRSMGLAVTVQSHDKDGWQPLHFAALNGHTSMVQFLIDQGANVNATARDSLRPLHIAARNGRLQVVKLLLGQGADVNARDKSGETPLLHSLIKGHVDIADILLAASGKEALSPDQGDVLLNLSVLHQPVSVRWAIRHGANPAAKDTSGRTPLHLITDITFLMGAQLGGDGEDPTEVASLLWEGGANADARNAAGQTPAEMLEGATSMATSVASLVASHSGSSAAANSYLNGSQTMTSRLRLLLDDCTTISSPKTLALKALTQPVNQRITYRLLGPILRAILDEIRKRNEGYSSAEVVQRTMQAVDFICPQCGPLNKELVMMAIAAWWAKEMNPNNPNIDPLFTGATTAAMYRGWCRQCHNNHVEVCFDPAKL